MCLTSLIFLHSLYINKSGLYCLLRVDLLWVLYWHLVSFLFCPAAFLLSFHAEPPTKYQISQPDVLTITPSKPLDLRCPYNDASLVTWNKDGVKLESSNRTVIVTNYLLINKTVPSDTGLYVCLAHKGAQSSTHFFLVNVTGEWLENGRVTYQTMMHHVSSSLWCKQWAVSSNLSFEACLEA